MKSPSRKGLNLKMNGHKQMIPRRIRMPKKHVAQDWICETIDFISNQIVIADMQLIVLLQDICWQVNTSLRSFWRIANNSLIVKRILVDSLTHLLLTPTGPLLFFLSSLGFPFDTNRTELISLRQCFYYTCLCNVSVHSFKQRVICTCYCGYWHSVGSFVCSSNWYYKPNWKRDSYFHLNRWHDIWWPWSIAVLKMCNTRTLIRSS